MANQSQIKRDEMLLFLESLKINTENKHIMVINEIKNFLTEKRYGLIWEEHEEAVDIHLKSKIPVFTEVKEKKILHDSEKPINFFLEGDNLHSLYLLEKTHLSKIDLITIDPPYNRGKDDFIYDDDIINEDDDFKHSKWLSFMNKRLTVAKRLLTPEGIIAINIDEHEISNLLLLMDEIFGSQNNLGTIVWNKKNPKGDAHRISTMHEYIVVYAKDYKRIKDIEGYAKRRKPNAEVILNKAATLFKLIGKKKIPEAISSYVKTLNYSKEILEQLKITYDLDLVNKEFKSWMAKQSFSGGEKAYKNIDKNGRVYRGVSMAWPNKKTAPDEYFTPLIHPITKKPTPVPDRGWRNPPKTMEKLLEEDRILFGVDEKKQPERKYYLEENMFENTPSIYDNADSADKYLSSIDVKFDYPKPVSEVKYLLKSLHPNPKIVLDFFAGSATTGHAVLEYNLEENKNTQFILCTNNQNGIADDTSYPRIFKEINNYSGNLKYFKTDYVDRIKTNELFLSDELLDHIIEMIELDFNIDFESNEKIYLAFSEEEVDKYFSNEIIADSKLLLPSFILLTNEQKNIAINNSISILIVPDYYFADELREVGEI